MWIIFTFAWEVVGDAIWFQWMSYHISAAARFLQWVVGEYSGGGGCRMGLLVYQNSIYGARISIGRGCQPAEKWHRVQDMCENKPRHHGKSYETKVVIWQRASLLVVVFLIQWSHINLWIHFLSSFEFRLLLLFFSILLFHTNDKNTVNTDLKSTDDEGK